MKGKTKLCVVNFFIFFILAPVIAWAAETYNFVRMWPVLPQPWYFSFPQHVAVDSQDNVFVADMGNQRIQKFDNNGNFIAKWGSEGSGDGQFDFPVGIAVDLQGNVFVADTSNHRIQVFAPAPVAVAPTVDLDSPKADLRTGDSFILDLMLKSGDSKSPIDLFFSIEIRGQSPTTIYLGPNLKFVPDRVPVVNNFIPVNARIRMFGPAPSISEPSVFGEFIIPSDVTGSFIFGAEVVDSGTEASINRDSLSITVNVIRIAAKADCGT